jgi:DnaJ domain
LPSSQHVPSRFLASVLDLYRRPENSKAWFDPQSPLPEGVSVVVELANLPPNAPRIEHYAHRLHASPSELHAAIGFFIRQVLLAAEADHYRVLGLNPGADIQRIRDHYRKLIGRFHPDRLQGHDEWYQNYSVRINQAYTVLRNPSKRRAYDGGLDRRTGPVSAARTGRHRSQPPRYDKRVSSVHPPSRRTKSAPLRALFTPPHIAWHSIIAFASMPRRWRRKAIHRHGPGRFWQRFGLLLSVAAIAGCLALVLNSARSLRLPSALNALWLGLSPSTAPAPAVNQADPAIDALPDSVGLTPWMPPANSAGVFDLTKNDAGTAPKALAGKGRTATAPEKRQTFESRSIPSTEADAMTSDHYNTASPPMTSEPLPRRHVQKHSKAPKIAVMRLSRLEAERLLNRFLWAYEAGSINHFMQLFDEQVRTGYQVHRDGIRSEYAQLFAGTIHRRIALDDFHWQLLGAKGTGEGQFVVTVQYKGETTPSVTRGRLILHIRKTVRGVLITELLHIRR